MNWREIPMKEINWRSLHSHLGRSAWQLKRYSLGYKESDPPRPYAEGAWKNMTLGEVSDLGRRELMRHSGMGPVCLAALQYVIDLAAAGKCPVIGGVAPDALRPSEPCE
jgi:hypothetical protein